MSDEVSTIMYKTVTTPELTSSDYASQVADMVDIINDNFRRIAGSQVFQGIKGDSITLGTAYIFDESTNKVTDTGAIILNAIFDKLSSYTIAEGNTFDMVKSAVDSSTAYQILNNVSCTDWWKDSSDNYINNKIVMFMYEGSEDMIFPAQMYNYMDPRTSEFTDNENLEDATGLICVKLSNDGSEYTWTAEKNNFFPTLEYSDGAWKWSINGQTTNIVARGPKGAKGNDGVGTTVHLVQASHGDNDTSVFNIITRWNGTSWSDTDMISDGDLCLMYSVKDSVSKENDNFAIGYAVKDSVTGNLTISIKQKMLFTDFLGDILVKNALQDIVTTDKDGNSSGSSYIRGLFIPALNNTINGDENNYHMLWKEVGTNASTNLHLSLVDSNTKTITKNGMTNDTNYDSNDMTAGTLIIDKYAVQINDGTSTLAMTPNEISSDAETFVIKNNGMDSCIAYNVQTNQLSIGTNTNYMMLYNNKLDIKSSTLTSDCPQTNIYGTSWINIGRSVGLHVNTTTKINTIAPSLKVASQFIGGTDILNATKESTTITTTNSGTTQRLIFDSDGLRLVGGGTYSTIWKDGDFFWKTVTA